MKELIIVDIEATCCDDGSISKNEQETIEIGAVILSLGDNVITGEFQSFIKPRIHPALTDFCTNLTTITQPQVDYARPFPIAFSAFNAFACQNTFASWGRFDWNVLKQDSDRCGMVWPFTNHINLSAMFKKKYGCKRGHGKAMRILGIEPTGTHHRGIDDARNISKIAPLLFEAE